MKRSTAWEELTLRVRHTGILRHSLAMEAVMRHVALSCGEDVAQWGLAGLLHDIDVERIGTIPVRHGELAAEILENLDCDPTIVFAIRAHNPTLGLDRRRRLDKALYCFDVGCRLAVATALRTPEKRLERVSVADLLACHANPDCAPSLSREQMETCCELEMSLETSYHLILEAMKAIGEDLGL